MRNSTIVLTDDSSAHIRTTTRKVASNSEEVQELDLTSSAAYQTAAAGNTIALAEALADNTHLTSLTLDDCALTDREGCVAQHRHKA